MKKITPKVYKAIAVTLLTILSWIFISPGLTRWYLSNFEMTFMSMVGVFLIIVFQVAVCLYFWALCENEHTNKNDEG